jgi:hypothetical protein
VRASRANLRGLAPPARPLRGALSRALRDVRASRANLRGLAPPARPLRGALSRALRQ